MHKKGYTLDQIADVAETNVAAVEAVIKKKKPHVFGSFVLVLEMGLEPTHCCQRQILSLMRLPFRHSCVL